MAKGGARKGAGRPKGAKSKKRRVTEAVVAHFIDSGEDTPLDIMLSTMTQAWKVGDVLLAIQVAKDAAPYVHSRLATTEVKATVDAAVYVTDEQDRKALKHFTNLKLRGKKK